MGSSQRSVSVSPTYCGDEEEHSPPEGDHTALVLKPEPTLEGDLWGRGRVWVQAACQRDADDGGVQADRGCGPSSPPSLCTPGFLGMLPPVPTTRLNWATRFSQQDVYGRCKQRPQQGLLPVPLAWILEDEAWVGPWSQEEDQRCTEQPAASRSQTKVDGHPTFSTQVTRPSHINSSL